MADLIVVLGVLAFAAISAAFVWGCDRILGPDPEPPSSSIDGGTDDEAPIVSERAS